MLARIRGNRGDLSASIWSTPSSSFSSRFFSIRRFFLWLFSRELTPNKLDPLARSFNPADRVNFFSLNPLALRSPTFPAMTSALRRPRLSRVGLHLRTTVFPFSISPKFAQTFSESKFCCLALREIFLSVLRGYGTAEWRACG